MSKQSIKAKARPQDNPGSEVMEFATGYYTENGTIKNPDIMSRRSWDKEVFIVQVKEDKSSQGQECSDTQVEGNLVGGQFFVLATSPYADHDKSGDQRQFVKEIHKEHVQRHKGTQNAATHQ